MARRSSLPSVVVSAPPVPILRSRRAPPFGWARSRGGDGRASPGVALSHGARPAPSTRTLGRGYSLRSRLQCRCWATALMNSAATPLIVSALSHHDSRRGLLLAGPRLARADPCRLEQRRALTGGPDGLAVLVGLPHELHRARLGHQGGRALLPPGTNTASKRTEPAVRKLQSTVTSWPWAVLSVPRRGAMILDCAPAALRARCMAESAAPSTPSAARMATLRVCTPFLTVLAMLRAGELPILRAERLRLEVLGVAIGGHAQVHRTVELLRNSQPQSLGHPRRQGLVDLGEQPQHALPDGHACPPCPARSGGPGRCEPSRDPTGCSRRAWPG